MATENKVLVLSCPAGEDLSNDKYRIVILNADGTVRRPNAATDIPLGVLQNAPAAGEAASVCPIGSGGVSKIVLGATVAAGVRVACEYVDAADAGKAQAAVATQYPVGLLTMGGDEDDLGSVLMSPISVF